MNKISETPKPDFVDHFPRTTRGHGRVIRRRVVGMQDGKVVEAITRAKPCQQATCELNMKGNGEKHGCGRPANGAEWMRSVGYNGPDAGISREEKAKVRTEARVHGPKHNCHSSCVEVGAHSVCLMPTPFRVGVGERMAELVAGLAFSTKQQEHRVLGRYMGVDVRWRG